MRCSVICLSMHSHVSHSVGRKNSSVFLWIITSITEEKSIYPIWQASFMNECKLWIYIRTYELASRVLIRIWKILIDRMAEKTFWRDTDRDCLWMVLFPAVSEYKFSFDLCRVVLLNQSKLLIAHTAFAQQCHKILEKWSGKPCHENVSLFQFVYWFLRWPETLLIYCSESSCSGYQNS